MEAETCPVILSLCLCLVSVVSAVVAVSCYVSLAVSYCVCWADRGLLGDSGLIAVAADSLVFALVFFVSLVCLSSCWVWFLTKLLGISLQMIGFSSRCQPSWDWVS